MALAIYKLRIIVPKSRLAASKYGTQEYTPEHSQDL